jgi:hypothetical protein
MDNIIKADVTAVAPELATSLTDQFWLDLLTFANEFDFTSLDTEQTVRMARIFLCAHLGARAKRSGTGVAGPVISEAAGGVRRSYGLVSSTGGALTDLGSTQYGQTLEFILTSSGAHGPVLI